MVTSSKIKQLKGKDSDFLELVLPAASTGKIEALREYLHVKPGFVRAAGPHGRTVLWEAARKGKFDVVCFLVELGAPLDTRGCYFRETKVEVTLWCVATLNFREDVAQFLAERGAAYTIDSACYLGDMTYIETQLANDLKSADRPVPSASGECFRPIHYAVAAGNLEALRMLISAGVDPTNDGERLVSWALDLEETSILELMLKSGARPRRGDANEACLDPRWSGILAKYGYTADVNSPNRLGFPPLVEACRGNHNSSDNPERIVQLLAMGADVNVRDHKGKTPLHRAAQAGFLKSIAHLIEAGANLDAVDERGETPLFDAVRAHRVEAVQEILRLGANGSHKNKLEQTVLLLAKRSTRPDATKLMKVLLKH